MSNFSPNQTRHCTRFTGSPCVPEKDTRETIAQEITNKVKYCSNPTYECSQMRIDGYDYCIRHILRDTRAHYRQCTHIYSNGRKCQNAVPKYDLKKELILTTLCFEHNRKTQLAKTHAEAGRLGHAETNETLLNNLAHHLHVDEVPDEPVKNEQDDDVIDVVSPHVTPFVNHDQINNIATVVSNVRKRRRVLDYASDSSDNNNTEVRCLKNTARDLDYHESDYESVDSEEDDPLKHASVFTRSEIVRMAENKLIKLQELYKGQMKNLQLVLKEKRRRYLHDIRKERETYCSIHDQLKDSPEERKLYEQLKALNSYHRHQGVEAVLYKKYKEKRVRSVDALAFKPPSYSKCMFTEGGVKCGDRTLPCSKFCRKHILEDKRQVLFRACSVERSGVICQEPVASIFDDATCVLHLTVPPKRQYIQKKYESETEEDDGLSLTAASTSANGSKVNQQSVRKVLQKGVKIESVCVKVEQLTHFEGSKDNVTIKHENDASNSIKEENICES